MRSGISFVSVTGEASILIAFLISSRGKRISSEEVAPGVVTSGAVVDSPEVVSPEVVSAEESTGGSVLPQAHTVTSITAQSKAASKRFKFLSMNFTFPFIKYASIIP